MANAPLALERNGFVSGFKVKPRKKDAKGKTAYPSTIIFSIETPNDPKLIAFLSKIASEGEGVAFGLDKTQAELVFPEDASAK